MRFFYLCLLAILALCQLEAQSLYWQTTTYDQGSYNQRQLQTLGDYQNDVATPKGFTLAPMSYYTGGGTLFEVSESAAFDETFSISGDLVFNVLPSFSFSGWTINLPFRGSLETLISELNATGELGIYPFTQVPENNPSYDLVIHGGYEGAINPDSTGFENSRRLTRLFFGVEASIYISGNQRPWVVGLTPIWTNAVRLENSFGLELTNIFQVAEGFGFLARGYLGLSGPRVSGLQTGVVLIGARKGSRGGA